MTDRHNRLCEILNKVRTLAILGLSLRRCTYLAFTWSARALFAQPTETKCLFWYSRNRFYAAALKLLSRSICLWAAASPFFFSIAARMVSEFIKSGYFNADISMFTRARYFKCYLRLENYLRWVFGVWIT